MRYILALLFLASSAFAQNVTYPYSSASSSGGITSLTNGQVLTTNIANGAVTPAKTDGTIMYSTNGASYTIDVPAQTGVWFKVASINVNSPTTISMISVRLTGSSGSDATKMLLEYSPSAVGQGGRRINVLYYDGRATNGFGGVGSDGSAIYVQVTNLSHSIMSGFTLRTAAWSFESGAQSATITAITTNSISDVAASTISYMTPGNGIRYERGDFDFLTLGGSNVMTSAGGGGGVTDLNGTNGSINIDGGSNITVTRTNGAINISSGAGGGGDVYTTNNNVFVGKTNTIVGKLEFVTNATQVDRFALFQGVAQSTNVLIVQNQGGDRTDMFIMYGKGGSVTNGVSAIKIVNDSVIGPSNTALVLRSNRGFSGTHTNGFAVTLKNGGGAALEPLFFLMDEQEVFHYGTDLKTKFQQELTVMNGGIGVGTTNLVGDLLRVQGAVPMVSLNNTSAADYGTLNWRENGTQMAILQQIGSTFSGSLGSGNRQRDLEIAAVEGGDIVFHVGNGGSFSHKYMLLQATNGFLGILTNNPQEALSVNGNFAITGSRKVNGIWQGDYLGPRTNINPTTVTPLRQADWYIDTGSNTVVVSMDGTTNGWRWTPLNAF